MLLASPVAQKPIGMSELESVMGVWWGSSRERTTIKAVSDSVLAKQEALQTPLPQ
jgi:hypothetical protein